MLYRCSYRHHEQIVNLRMNPDIFHDLFGVSRDSLPESFCSIVRLNKKDNANFLFIREHWLELCNLLHIYGRLMDREGFLQCIHFKLYGSCVSARSRLSHSISWQMTVAWSVAYSLANLSAGPKDQKNVQKTCNESCAVLNSKTYILPSEAQSFEPEIQLLRIEGPRQKQRKTDRESGAVSLAI